ncbi:hypothetical protein FKW77_006181 [Venturia effusa]|uniref:Uncharacterized protein n=1 Tax=Venturia effusa TaxID=50376 RepID=A0A517LHD1_9PEZI|nr:hypothetical protein FKW77_006181 [Venturia effusa]
MDLSNPPAYAHPHRRRLTSTRRSSGNRPKLPLALSSHRGPMPRDTNAFSYQMEHIDVWLMPENVYKALPDDLRARIKNLQQSGAALNTALQRLDGLREQLSPSAINDTSATTENLSEAQMPLTVVNGKLYEYQARRRASENDKEKYDCVPIPPEYRSFGSTNDMVFSSDQNTPNTNVTGCSSPTSLGLSPHPDSPAPFDIGEPTLSRQSSNKMAGPPENAQIGQYWAQLVHFREMDIVRLRHSIRPIDIEFNILGRPSPPSSPTAFAGSPAKSVAVDDPQQSAIDFAFQVWWPEKKAMAESLIEKCKAIDAHVQPTLSCWSDVPPAV